MRNIINMKKLAIMTLMIVGLNAHGSTNTETDSFIWTQSGTFSNGAVEIIKTTPSSTTSNNLASFWSIDTEFNATTQSILSASVWTNYVLLTNMAYSSYEIVRGRVFINQTNGLTANYPITFTYYDSPASNSYNQIYSAIMGLSMTLATNSAGTAQSATNIYVNDNSPLSVGSLIWYGGANSEYRRVLALPATNNIVITEALAYAHAASNAVSRVREFSGGLCDSTRSYSFFYSVIATQSVGVAGQIQVTLEYTK